MFLEAVVSDHSLDSKGFTYFVPEHLRASVRRGCVVEVPFGEELVAAVVTEVDAPPPDRTEAKAVAGVLVSNPVVHPYQIEAAYELSKRYFVFLHTALSFFISAPVLRRFVKIGSGYPEAGKRWILADSAETSPKPALVYDRDGVWAGGLFWNRIPATPGTVLILPSDAAVDAFLKETSVDADSFLVHKDSLTEAKDFRLRLSVAAGEAPFLVWSRRLCSYNLAAYPRIAYFEDSLFSEARHKFFHSYDHMRLLESFAASYRFQLTVSSFVPSSRLMALAAKGDWILENA